MQEPLVSTTYTEFAGMLDELFGPPTVGDSRPPANPLQKPLHVFDLEMSGQSISSEQSFLGNPCLVDLPASLQHSYDNPRITHELFPGLPLAQQENEFSSSSPNYFDHRSPGLPFDPVVAPLACFTDVTMAHHGPHNALMHVNTFPAVPVGLNFSPHHPVLSPDSVIQAHGPFSYFQGHPDFPPCTCPRGRPCGLPRDRCEAEGSRPLVILSPPVGVADGLPSEEEESSDVEPRMLRCEWEGKCGACIAPDQASVNRHLRTHITEELAKLMSGAADTTVNGKPKVRYLFDPTRSGFPSGIQLDDIEVGARVRIVMEKGKVWARCLWGADGCCVYSRTTGEKDKGELTLEYLPRHIWGIHFGMSR